MLTEALEEVSRVVAPDGLHFDDLDEFGGRTFDYYGQRPDSARLPQGEAGHRLAVLVGCAGFRADHEVVAAS